MALFAVYRYIIIGVIVLASLAACDSHIDDREKPVIFDEANIPWAGVQHAHYWQDSTELNTYLQEIIAESYCKALAVLTEPSLNQDHTVISQYFTGDLSTKILSQKQKPDQEFDQTNISHHLELVRQSHDGLLVQFRDLEKVTASTMGARSTLDTSVVDVIMILEDERWKVKLIQESESKNALPQIRRIKEISTSGIRGVNYYPSDKPWLSFWSEFDIATIAHDFQQISSYDYNVVRLFVPYRKDPHQDLLSDISRCLNEAEKNNLKIVLCLFDFPDGYRPKLFPYHQYYLTQIVNSTKDHSALHSYDLKNEADLDFKNYGEDVVINWLRFVSSSVRNLAPTVPLTTGWSSGSDAPKVAEQLDYISYHHYGNLQDLASIDNSLKGLEKPLVISEYGMSTHRWLGNAEEKQAQYLSEHEEYFQEKSVGHIVWTYTDYENVPSYVFGRKFWVKNKQANFGLIKTDGNPKPYLRDRQSSSKR